MKAVSTPTSDFEVLAEDGWEQHRREQLRRWRELSPQQRLDWLWQARQFAAKAAQARQPSHEGSPASLRRQP